MALEYPIPAPAAPRSTWSIVKRVLIVVFVAVFAVFKLATAFNVLNGGGEESFWNDALKNSGVVSGEIVYGSESRDGFEYVVVFIPDDSTPENFEAASRMLLNNFSSDPDESGYVEKYNVKTDSCVGERAARECRILVFHNENLNAENVAAGVSTIRHFAGVVGSKQDNAEIIFTASSTNPENTERLTHSGDVQVTYDAAGAAAWENARGFMRDSLPGYNLILQSFETFRGYTTDYVTAEQLKTADMTSTVSANYRVAEVFQADGCQMMMYSGENKLTVICDYNEWDSKVSLSSGGESGVAALLSDLKAKYPGVTVQFVSDTVELCGCGTIMYATRY